MSKALKAFDKVTLLKADGSNWDTWSSRAERVAISIGYKKYLEWKSEDNMTSTQKDEDNDLLNAMIGRLSDSIFQRYKKLECTYQLWSALKKDYDSKNTLTEAYLQQQLHTMRCFDVSKINSHLDTMLEICDSLETRGIKMEDNMFNNTIIASIPDIFKPTVNALVVVASKTEKEITPLELIATIHAEAMGYVKKGQGKKESANYARNSNRGRGNF
jgi:hypothetical protein